jgi:hypothetical protein
MQELKPNENGITPGGQVYRPPVFKKDFFDNLIKNENRKAMNDIETHIEDKEKDDKPAPPGGIISRVFSMFHKKEDVSIHKVSKILIILT